MKKRIAFIQNVDTMERWVSWNVPLELLSGLLAGCEERELWYDAFDRRMPLASLEKKVKLYEGVIGLVQTSNAAQRAAWVSLQKNIPCVNLMIDPPVDGANYVGVDDAAAMTKLVDHLIDEDHPSIGYFGIESERYALERFAAYKERMAAKKRTVRQEWVFGYDLAGGGPSPGARRFLRRKDETPDEHHQRMEKAFDSYFGRKRPSAVIFNQEVIAVYAADYVRRHGLHVPEDIALTCVDENSRRMRHYLMPPLTAAAQDHRGLGRMAAHLLADIIDGKRPPRGQRVVLPPKLIIRRSSRRRTLTRLKDAFADSVREHAEQHFADPELLDDLCVITGLSRKYFLEKFLREFKAPFSRWIGELRINRAAGMLEHSLWPVREIVARSGYTTHQRFTRAFRGKYGLTAEAYRSMKKQQSE